MKRDFVHYPLVGAVDLAAFALRIFLLRITGSETGKAGSVAHSDDVTRLAPGAPMFYEGFPVGHVAEITPKRRDGRARHCMQLSIRGGWPIPDDSQSVATGLLTDVPVESRNSQAATMLKPGATTRPQGGGNLFASMSGLAGEDTTSIRDRNRPLVASLRRSIDRIGGENADASPQLVTEAKELLTRPNQIAAAMHDLLSPSHCASRKATLEDLAATAENARALSHERHATRRHLDALLIESGLVLGENRPALRDTISDLARIIDSLAQRIDGFAQNRICPVATSTNSPTKSARIQTDCCSHRQRARFWSRRNDADPVHRWADRSGHRMHRALGTGSSVLPDRMPKVTDRHRARARPGRSSSNPVERPGWTRTRPSFTPPTRWEIRASHDQLWEEASATMLQNRMISAQRTRSAVDPIAARLPANVPALRIRDQSERFGRGHRLKGCFAGVALELEVDRDPHSAPRLAQRYSAEVPAETETIRPSVRAFARAIDRCHTAFWSELESLVGE